MKGKNQFKQTELGLIPQEWDVVTLDEIKASEKNSIAMGPFGSNIKKEHFVSDGVPVIRGNNLNSYRFLDDDFVYLTEAKANALRSSNCQPGDIVITHRGTLGQVGLIPRKSRYKRYVVSQSGMKLTCDDTLAVSDFVFYFLKSPSGQRLLLRNTSQTGVPAIALPLTSLKSTPIPIPGLKEQKKISRVLNCMNDKIDLLKKQNETLGAIGELIFKHWFVDFEFINVEGKPYKSSGGKMAYNAELRRRIPIDWNVCDLIREFNLVMGQSPPGSSYNKIGSGIAFFQGKAEFGTRFPSVRMYCTEPTRVAKKGDTLVTVRAPVGDVNQSLQDCCIGRGLAAVRHKSNLTSYTYYYMRSLKPIFDRFEAEGTVFGSINKTDFEKIKVLSVSSETSDSFESMVKPLDNKIKENTRQIVVLSDIRDALLPKLMNGKIRVNGN